MIQLKRTSGPTTRFQGTTHLTPYISNKTAPWASTPPYVALGFVARTAEGKLLRPNALYGATTTITYRRRRIPQMPA